MTASSGTRRPGTSTREWANNKSQNQYDRARGNQYQWFQTGISPSGRRMIKSSVLGVWKKKKTSWRWRMEGRKKKGTRWKVEIIDVSYPETPAAAAFAFSACHLCFFLLSSSCLPSACLLLSLTLSCVYTLTSLFSSFNLLLFTFHTPSLKLTPRADFLCLHRRVLTWIFVHLFHVLTLHLSIVP